MEKAQILEGILEGCILLIISKENTYGYGILETLKQSGFKDITEFSGICNGNALCL